MHTFHKQRSHAFSALYLRLGRLLLVADRGTRLRLQRVAGRALRHDRLLLGASHGGGCAFGGDGGGGLGLCAAKGWHEGMGKDTRQRDGTRAVDSD